MKKSLQLIIAAATISVFPLAASAQTTLAGSFLLEGGTGTDLPSFVEPARTASGNLDTRGAVAGDVGGLAGNPIIVGYNGIDYSNFSFITVFRDMNRFGGALGGLLTWDFDFSTFLSGKTIGTGAGESSFAVDLDYSDRRADALQGVFYISTNGSGLTLDETLMTSLNPGDGVTVVGDAAEYAQIGTLPANVQAGTANFDITSFLANSSDGKVRIAYLDNSFRGSIGFQNMSGIVETVNIPEPATVSGFFAVGALAFVVVYRSRRRA